MTLSEQDGQLFYQLWLPLLDYVNEKCKVNKNVKNMAHAKSLDPQQVKEIANVLWDDVSLIEQYLIEQGRDMPGEHKEIISGWKQRVQGRFVMERHLKKGTIFVSEDGKVYQVQGIISSWEEMFQFAPMPLLMEATFIPFRDVIISDGLVMPYNVIIGSNMAKQFKDTYMDAKKNGMLIKSIKNYIHGDKKVQNKKWKKFDKLTGKCYFNMAGAEEDGSCWFQAFELMKEIVLEERKNNPGFASELEMIDEITDYAFDIQGWLEDCLDEIDMREDYETLLKMCNDLLELFDWPEYTGSDIKFRKAAAMAQLGQKKESAEFCKKWLQKEPENIIAACAGVYAFIEVNAFEEAEKLIEQFIPDKSRCSEENDMMFVVASTLYQVTGRKKEKKEVDKAMKEYEEYLKEYFEFSEFDEEEEEFFEEELPF